ncbi:MAG: AAA family ATPase, partial [Thermoguttaceae bacterium]|nr:AAA family ATPase [Thermoguttaceae bacterium]
MRPRSELLDQTPPAADEAERAVLGSIILRLAALDEIGGILHPEDFRLPGHRALYRHLVAMHAAREAVDEITLVNRLKAAGDWALVGGAAGLVEISQSVAVAAHAAYYARLVVEAARRRRMREAGVRLIQAAHDVGSDPVDSLANVEGELAAIVTSDYSSGPVSAEQAAVEFCLHIDAVRERKRGAGLLTGISGYDQGVGGLFPGELVILAARPGQGKTAMLLQLCHHAAEHGDPALIVSLEMSRLELTTRLACGMAGVDSRRVRTGAIDEVEAAKLAEAASAIARSKLHILDRPATTVADIRRESRHVSRRDGLALLAA